MRMHMRAVVIALLIGLIGFVVLFTFGSWTGRGIIGIAAAVVFYAYGGVFLVRKYPASRWYGGALLSIPIWLFFKFLADTGQFENFFPGLVGCLISSYVGTFLGLWLLRRKVVLGMATITVLIVVPILLSVLAAYILNAPKPVPPEKNLFVGVWTTGSGFKLQISSNGTAELWQDVNDTGTAYENLNIKVAPSHIEGANVEFRDDSALVIVKPAYYGRLYRIDKHPYSDSTLYKMVLNGVTLVRK